MKLSIITVNKNNRIGIEKTIKSVINQNNKDYEYIVIDGNSTDGSADIIKKYSEKINYWVSENDSGIYNAMNKGIRRANGEYCLFLNSGDLLKDDSILTKLFEELKNTEYADIYYTDCTDTNRPHCKPPKILDINYLVIHNLNHQNTIIKRSLFIDHGYYNEYLKISSDYDFWLREFWVYKSIFKYINTSISIYDSYGISSKSNFDSELEDSIKRNFGSIGDSLIKLRRYCHSPYGTILDTYGNSKFIDLCLKAYKIFLRFVYPSEKVKKFSSV